MTDNAYNRLLKRVVSNLEVLGGEPCIRGTRIHVAVVLESLAEGLTPVQIADHYPPLTERGHSSGGGICGGRATVKVLRRSTMFIAL